MKYCLYKLKFMTPVHFGNSAGGGKLDRVSLTCSADTYFSALCQEAADLGKSVDKFVKLFLERKLMISSLFPYFDNIATKELELYLPKPFIIGKAAEQKATSYQEVKIEATALKKLKKSVYIRSSEMESFYTAMMNGERYATVAPVFASENISTRVNMRGEQPLPYYVGSYVFREEAGLYFVVAAEEEENLALLTELVESLGYSGIGGKKSSGYGKYEASCIFLEAENQSPDMIALEQLLTAEESATNMCIAPLCPENGQGEAVKSGSYKLIKRSGFVASDKENIKRSSFYMLAEGSCFAAKLKGEMKRIRIPGLPYEVCRNGMGMYVGVGKND